MSHASKPLQDKGKGKGCRQTCSDLKKHGCKKRVTDFNMSGQLHVSPDLSNRISHCPTSVRSLL